MMREKRQRRVFTEEFKKQIVTLYNNGKPRVQLIKEYDLPRSVLAKWMGYTLVDTKDKEICYTKEK